MIILDTNVISELVKATPDRTVMTRVRGFRSADLCTTAITEAELRQGLAILPPGRRATAMRLDLETVLVERLGARIVSFDSAAAKEYATLTANRMAAGRPISIEDAQIAAIVKAHRATLVTRNTKDFENCGFEVINPWK